MIDFTQKCTKRKMSKIKMYEKKNVQNRKCTKRNISKSKGFKIGVFSRRCSYFHVFIYRPVTIYKKSVRALANIEK